MGYPPISLFSQAPIQPTFRHLSTQEGLSFNRAFEMVQAPEGYIWIATADGLNRYDGKKCVPYKHNRSESSLSDNWISCLHIDASEQLWVGTHSGLCKYDSENDVFIRISNPATDTLAGEKRIIYVLFSDKKGNLWMGTEKGLAVLYKGQTQITPLKIPQLAVTRNLPVDIVADKKGNIWFTTSNGLHCYTPENQSYTCYQEPVPQGQDPRLYNFFTKMYLDNQGILWIGQWGAGLFCFDIEKKVFTANYLYSPLLHGKRTGIKNVITDMVMQVTDKGDSLFWVATMDGLAIFDRKTKTFTFFNHDVQNPESLAFDQINTLMIDKYNTIWVALEENGVDRYNAQMRKFPIQQLPLQGQKNGIWEINSLIEDNQDPTGNTFWIGVYDYGLLKWKQAENIFTHYPFRQDARKAYKERAFEQLCQDANGRIWIATGIGLEYFVPETGRFFRLKTADTLLKKRHLKTLFIDKQQNIWIGTRFETNQPYHFAKYNPQNNTVEWGVFPKCASTISKIIEDAQGDIWVATRREGLLKLPQGSMQPQTWHLFQTKYKDSLSFPLEVVWDMIPTATNQLGIVGSFVTFWDTKKDSYQHFTTAEGLSHDHTYYILQDKTGTFWFFSRNGLTRMDKQTGKTTRFSMQDGLLSNWLSGAVLLSQKGGILYGHEDKLQVFLPENIKVSAEQTPLTFSELKILNEKYPLRKDKKGNFLPIALSWQQNMIDISFIAFDYLHPERIQYAYKMEGYDKDWIYKENINTATYTNLDGGTYTFKVKATNGDGVWGQKEWALPFEISPPFWKTKGFIGLIISLFLLGVWLVYQYRMKRLQEKTDFSIQLIQSELRVLRAQMNPHFIFNSLNAIHGYILSEEKQKAAQHLLRFAKLMRMMLHNSEKNTVLLKEEIAMLELYLTLEQVRCKQAFTFEIKYAEGIDIDFIQIPTMILQPFVENAIWHGIMPQKSGHISLSFSLKNDNLLQIKLIDDGIGREKSRLLNSETLSSHRSVAINAISERIRLMENAQLFIHDLTQGTCIEILLGV